MIKYPPDLLMTHRSSFSIGPDDLFAGFFILFPWYSSCGILQEEKCELEMYQMEIADVLPAPFQNIFVDPATMAQARGNLS